MHNDTRFDLMKNDLCKAAVTIHKLKRERDQYKLSYELLKDDTDLQKSSYKNDLYLEELLESSQSMQKELLRYKKLLMEKDRTIAELEKNISKINFKFTKQQKSFKELDTARKELKNEINNTNLSSENYPMYSEISHLADHLLTSLHQNPSIDSIFKGQVQCKNRFLKFVEQENYSVCCRYLMKFVIEMLDSFQFCEEFQSDLSYPDEQYENTGFSTEEPKYPQKERNRRTFSRDDTNTLEESLKNQSQRLQLLNRKMTQISDEVKEKKVSEEREEKNYRAGGVGNLKNLKNLNNLKIGQDRNFRNEERENSIGSNPTSNRSLSKSKSPPRSARSFADKYQDYCSPILRKTDCWGSAAEFFGGEHPKTPKKP